jgi:hypothetical protein
VSKGEEFQEIASWVMRGEEFQEIGAQVSVSRR